MNIHHLELFYYVAKHGGIMEAVRNMPYGIQQPAVSGQIIQLEDSLGVKLFQRRPFLLSPGGQKLYDSIRPFFDSIDDVCEQIREGTSELIRLGAPTLVLDRYFPEIIHALKETLPDVKFALKEGHTNQVLKLLLDGQIDIAITTLTEDIPKGVHQTPLIDIELNLLVPKNPRSNPPSICGNKTASPTPSSPCRRKNRSRNIFNHTWKRSELPGRPGSNYPRSA